MASRMANDVEVKQAIKLLADLMTLGSNVAAGFSFKEIGEVIGAISEVKSMIKVAGLLFPEFKALDDDARADLTAFVQANVKFPSNLQVETVAQELLTALVALSKVFGGPEAPPPPAPVPAP